MNIEEHIYTTHYPSMRKKCDKQTLMLRRDWLHLYETQE